MKYFLTSSNVLIPKSTMRNIASRIELGDDWQDIITEELRRFIPESEDDLDVAMEVLRAAEDFVPTT